MKNISIDIETFSSVDLTRCGVYKYAESPDFQILLFGYSVDGGEVQVIDLASGESIPKDVLAALTDDEVIKWAPGFWLIWGFRLIIFMTSIHCQWTVHGS